MARTREEILKDLQDPAGHSAQLTIVELLLDIRDRLELIRKKLAER